MQVLFAFSVFDNKANCFGRPFFVTHVGVALRGFGDEVNNSESPFNAHPEDYALYELGSWDDSDGVFKPLSKPKLISNAVPLLKVSVK